MNVIHLIYFSLRGPKVIERDHYAKKSHFLCALILAFQGYNINRQSSKYTLASLMAT
jgi:hypothetical protein